MAAKESTMRKFAALIPVGLVFGALFARKALAKSGSASSSTSPSGGIAFVSQPWKPEVLVGYYQEHPADDVPPMVVFAMQDGSGAAVRKVAAELQRRSGAPVLATDEVNTTLANLVCPGNDDALVGIVQYVMTENGPEAAQMYCVSGDDMDSGDWRQIVENAARERFIIPIYVQDKTYDDALRANGLIDRASVFIQVYDSELLESAMEAVKQAARETTVGLRFVVADLSNLDVQDRPSECVNLGEGVEVYQARPMLAQNGDVVIQRTGVAATSCNPSVILGNDPVPVLRKIIMERRPGVVSKG